MEVIRKIGNHELLVETSEACGIYLEETLVAQIAHADSVALEKREILSLLACGDDYFPLTLHWELLDRCNLACPFCYIVGHSFNRVIRLVDIIPHLEELIQEGLLFCTLTGGESTLHPDFPAIYRFLKERGVIVEVFTNGVAIDETLIDLFTALPPVTVEVSLYTFKDTRMAEVFGARTSGAASKVLSNVLKMKGAGVKVVCKTFMNTLTYEEAEEMARWCDQNEIEHYESSEINSAYDGTDLRSFEVKKSERKGRSSDRAICLPCGTKNYGSAINSAFAIYPCPSIKLSDCTYDLRALGVAESLRRMKSFMRRFQNQEIRGGCNTSGGCASCMAYARPVRDESGALSHFAQP